MRPTLVLVLALTAMLPAVSSSPILAVDDGAFLYDANDDCVGDTDTLPASLALHHWHYAAPMATHEHEATGGFGCLGPPRSWSLEVPAGETARVEGRFKYASDIHFVNGCCTDVHLLVTDADGSVAYSTLVENGPDPVVKAVAPIKTKTFDFTLGPGSYTLTEDVTTGVHSTFVTRIFATLGG